MNTSAIQLDNAKSDQPAPVEMPSVRYPRSPIPDAAATTRLGHVVAFTQRLTRGGHTVGRVSNAAIGVDNTRQLFQANGTIVLAHGTIEYGGLVSLGSHFVLAVTGGTGEYTGTGGSISFDFPGHRQLLTVTLKR